LGERILNQLVLTLRHDYAQHPATRHVTGKHAFDDWRKCIVTLHKWAILNEATAQKYIDLMYKRHAAVHYRRELDTGVARDAAMAAVKELSDLVHDIFTPIGESHYYFSGPIGRSYVRLVLRV